ncbi:hypothetical protein STEG23_036181, partial [Scotinomys teguina]
KRRSEKMTKVGTFEFEHRDVCAQSYAGYSSALDGLRELKDDGCTRSLNFESLNSNPQILPCSVMSHVSVINLPRGYQSTRSTDTEPLMSQTTKF